MQVQILAFYAAAALAVRQLEAGRKFRGVSYLRDVVGEAR
jgi:hypothetical protein